MWVQLSPRYIECTLTRSYLIANRCKDEAECREEFGGTGIELGDDGGHIPLERAPEVAVR